MALVRDNITIHMASRHVILSGGHENFPGVQSVMKRLLHIANETATILRKCKRRRDHGSGRASGSISPRTSISAKAAPAFLK